MQDKLLPLQFPSCYPAASGARAEQAAHEKS